MTNNLLMVLGTLKAFSGIDDPSDADVSGKKPTVSCINPFTERDSDDYRVTIYEVSQNPPSFIAKLFLPLNKGPYIPVLEKEVQRSRGTRGLDKYSGDGFVLELYSEQGSLSGYLEAAFTLKGRNEKETHHFISIPGQECFQ
jgi:hypothetical protein